jgi:hypothetical protein
MASGHMNRVKRPDTWLHRPMLQNVKKVLANPEPSTHDPKADVWTHRCHPRSQWFPRAQMFRTNEANFGRWPISGWAWPRLQLNP